MIVRLSRKSREYILKSERDGFYEGEIVKVEKDLETITDEDTRKEKQDLIKELQKLADKAKAHLEKYGPAVFHLKSASKEELAKEMSKIKATIGTSKGPDKEAITAGMMGTTKYMAIRQFKLGFLSVDNVIDQDGVEDPQGKKPSVTISAKDVDDLIDSLPEYVIFEVASEIVGNVTEEETTNLN